MAMKKKISLLLYYQQLLKRIKLIASSWPTYESPRELSSWFCIYQMRCLKNLENHTQIRWLTLEIALRNKKKY